MKYKGGSLGIQAVPGAGKTFIITNLVADLIENMEKENVDSKILVLTYMNSAVKNFKNRIKTILEERNCPKTKFEVMTIHSLAMKIIRENTEYIFMSEETQILDDYKKEIIIQRSIDEFEELSENSNKIYSFIDKSKRGDKDIREKWKREFTSIILNSIKLLKYENIDEDNLKKIVNDVSYRGIMSIISPIYSNYQEILRQSSYIDYDDILLLAYNLLVDNPEIREKYQNDYDYIFEDECQDSNLIQGKIIELLAKNNKKTKYKSNLVRVGDVNQSITGTFTGSNPKFFVDFCKNADFNYNMYMAGRSSKDIIGLANYLVNYVRNSAEYFDQSLEELYIEEVEKGKGYKENPKPGKYMLWSKSLEKQEEQINTLIKMIKHSQNNFSDYSIGVLAFSNYEVDKLSEIFTANDIEHEKISSNNGQKTKVIEDLKSVIDFIIKPNDSNIFADMFEDVFIKRFKDFEIDDQIYKKIHKNLRKINPIDYIYDDEYFIKESKKIYSIVDNLIEGSFKGFLINTRDVLKKIIDYKEMDPSLYLEYIGENINLDISELDVLEYIIFYINNMANYENIDLNRLSIALDKRYSRIFDFAISAIYDIGEKQAQPGSIYISTLHKSKGLEWDTVIIMDINSTDYPSKLTDYYRVDRRYLRRDYKYPEAFINRELDLISGKTVKNMEDYEKDLKINLMAERIRLLYVGITRAKRSLILLNSRQKYIESLNKNFTKKNSKFFDVLDEFITEKRNTK